jgi:hypothetical protein
LSVSYCSCVVLFIFGVLLIYGAFFYIIFSEAEAIHSVALALRDLRDSACVTATATATATASDSGSIHGTGSGSGSGNHSGSGSGNNSGSGSGSGNGRDYLEDARWGAEKVAVRAVKTAAGAASIF